MTDSTDPELPAISPRLLRGFTRYVRRYMRRHVESLRLATADRPPPVDSAPTIVVLNHPGWWDPLICLMLSQALFDDWRHHAPIEQAQLARYRFFAKLGFFGVAPGASGARRFLSVGQAVLARERTMLWVTAQGCFADPRERPLILEPGVGHLAARAARGRILPLAIELPFWTERTPVALARFGAALRIEDAPGRSAADWTTEIARALTATMDALAAQAVARDREGLEPLLGGRVGVGGVYERFGRLTAWLRGRRFDPAHDRDASPKRAAGDA